MLEETYMFNSVLCYFDGAILQVAIASYEKRHEDELNMEIGDIITVHQVNECIYCP